MYAVGVAPKSQILLHENGPSGSNVEMGGQTDGQAITAQWSHKLAFPFPSGRTQVKKTVNVFCKVHVNYIFHTESDQRTVHKAYIVSIKY
jgi:hypothetical protein